MRLPLLVPCTFLHILASTTFGQNGTGISKISSDYIDAITDKFRDNSEDLDKQSAIAKAQMQKHEVKTYRKLSKIDSLKFFQ